MKSKPQDVTSDRAVRGYRPLEVPGDIDDPFQERGALSEPSVCPGCGAVYHAGRWQWGKAPADAMPARCAACRRIEENLPAGYVSIEGVSGRSAELAILGLVRQVEAREKIEDPLKRIMSIEESGDSILVATTNAQLARMIGEALHDALQGKLDLHFNEQEYLLRVRWQC